MPASCHLPKSFRESRARSSCGNARSSSIMKRRRATLAALSSTTLPLIPRSPVPFRSSLQTQGTRHAQRVLRLGTAQRGPAMMLQMQDCDSTLNGNSPLSNKRGIKQNADFVRCARFLHRSVVLCGGRGELVSYDYFIRRAYFLPALCSSFGRSVVLQR